MTRPLIFVWPWALLFWVVFFWAFAPEFAISRRAKKRVDAKQNADRSLAVIMVGMMIGMLLAFPLAFVRATRMPASMTFPAYWIGMAILLAGSLLRRHCFRVLGTYFTGDVQVLSEQPVIDRGAYRWVRHPSYTGGTLMFAGLGFALTNWASLAILVLSAVVTYSYRVHVEERALVQTLGDPYVAYMKRTKRFVPFLL